jgi:hypothetical protein
MLCSGLIESAGGFANDTCSRRTQSLGCSPINFSVNLVSGLIAYDYYHQLKKLSLAPYNALSLALVNCKFLVGAREVTVKV